MHVIIWEFEIRPEAREEFERVYGPAGDWARLFSRGQGYQGTELLADAQHPNRYLTIDRWGSRKEFEVFHQRHLAEYAEFDAKCEHLTTAERRIGDYREAGGHS